MRRDIQRPLVRGRRPQPCHRRRRCALHWQDALSLPREPASIPPPYHAMTSRTILIFRVVLLRTDFVGSGAVRGHRRSFLPSKRALVNLQSRGCICMYPSALEPVWQLELVMMLDQEDENKERRCHFIPCRPASSSIVYPPVLPDHLCRRP